MNKYKNHFWLFPAFVFLFLLRFFGSSELGLHDYDAITNFLASKKIVEGDFSMLFHHAAPFLHSFDAFFYLIFSSFSNTFTFLVYAQSVLQIVAILLLCSMLKKNWEFSATAAFFLTIFVGSSPLLVYSGRCLTIDNGSLLFIFLCIHFLNQENYKSILYLSVCFAIAFGFNYKSILILPFVFGYLFYKNVSTDFIKKITVFAGVNLLFLGFWTVIAKLFLGKWTAYLANLYYLIFQAHQREVTGEAWIEFDLFYYFKYIFYFENPLIWVGMGMVIFSVIKAFLKRKENQNQTNKSTKTVSKLSFDWKQLINQKIIFWLLLLGSIAVPTLFLEKAPRIWILVLLVAYSLSAWAFLFGELLNKFGKWLLFLGIIYNCWLIMLHIYSYSSTSYDEVTEFVKENIVKNELDKTEKIYLKGTLQPIPFFENAGINYEILPQNLDTDFTLKNKNKLHSIDSIFYILTDDYCILANDCLEAETIMNDKKNKYSVRNRYAQKYKLIKEWKEITLSEPFLYVEHSQYLGLNFSESYNLWQKQAKDSTTIRLYKVFR